MAYNQIYADKFDLLLLGLAAIAESDSITSFAFVCLAVKWSSQARRQYAPRLYSKLREFWREITTGERGERPNNQRPSRNISDPIGIEDVTSAFLEVDVEDRRAARNIRLIDETLISYRSSRV